MCARVKPSNLNVFNEPKGTKDISESKGARQQLLLQDLLNFGENWTE